MIKVEFCVSPWPQLDVKSILVQDDADLRKRPIAFCFLLMSMFE